MAKSNRKFSKWFFVSGLALVISAMVFTFYYVYVIFPFQYAFAIEFLTINVQNNCVATKMINSSLDLQNCFTEGKNFIASVPSMNQGLWATFFHNTNFNLALFFSPIILGIILIIAGLILKKMENKK